MNTRAMKPKIEFPHPSPNRSYMGCPARGRTAPTIDCRTLVAAIADAAYLVYESTRYIVITSYNSLANESRNNVELLKICWGVLRERELTKAGIIPMPNSEVPIMGTIQCVFVSTDQPYQKNAIAMRGHVNINGGNRNSGCETPLFFAVSLA
jgi:hypothetical protein